MHPNTHLVPTDWCNPFFDFALVYMFKNRVHLRTFQATVSTTHSEDGSIVQRVNQILLNVFGKTIHEVVHHAVVPSLEIALNFSWKDRANLEKVVRTTRSAPLLPESEVKTLEQEMVAKTKSRNLASYLVDPHLGGMKDLDEGIRIEYATLVIVSFTVVQLTFRKVKYFFSVIHLLLV
jgi:hypothetical protein